ncbi:hypothetical protein [Mycobacteroides abscessus]|uniref:hypothetical protein n=1 Tax=Mycobacteroides abscessus TaxID=36809 RepID=UPI00092CB2AE|nr:hypothetical protein [Mycobacteroides abscessus]SHX65765.1 Uncharacterised protein [Mycobacteroides abscessus subsp. abscessus]SHZ17195.1 Uncharacterised protein [Mycobacteroides abscessus subsp. abscessus]SIB51753.1 Uncharacterised protein [Mycobacteroides abscessus subsp. abscessus]SIF17377.1 Uncharacterised protein [Mycobacteroides abscessus subsp. abscessus]SKI47828.1 Uncharacterised protein [Mycobacteroides abscessus subsp. abscessus]
MERIIDPTDPEPLRWFCSIYPGWRPIVREMHNALTEADPDVEYVDIKQKWGELCVYIKRSTPETDEIVAQAAGHSRRVCEQCGERATMHQPNGGFWHALCCRCNAVQERKRSGPRAFTLTWTTDTDERTVSMPTITLDTLLNAAGDLGIDTSEWTDLYVYKLVATVAGALLTGEEATADLADGTAVVRRVR